MNGTSATAERLASLVTEVTGNLVPETRFGFLAEVAQRRAHGAGLPSAAEYVRALAAGELEGEWASLIPLLTIKESYFFRAPQQFEAIASQVLPRLLRAPAAGRRLRIWSAACARGEEPATLAMVLAGQADPASWEWSIRATDIDEEALAGARRGLYGERAVALVPQPLRSRWLARRGKLFELAPELRERIDYQPLNLARLPFLLPEDEYDLILLRNVLIYFDRPLQLRVMEHVNRLLSRKGALFLGASETLWQIQDHLEAVDLGTCYCYRHRRPGSGATAAGAQARTETPAAAKSRFSAASAAPASSRASSEAVSSAPPDHRVSPARQAGHAASPAGPPGPASPAAPPGATTPAGPPGPATPANLPGAPSAAHGEPPAPSSAIPRSALELLLTAAHRLAANDLAGARQATAEALAADPSEPAMHLLEGFLHDLDGQTDEAAASYRAALYLDPSLFQPRLLLADCFLRLGQRHRAEHQYREVLAALEANRGRETSIFQDLLPLPDRERALRRCHQALRTS
jgi:chemotaxis protein methyltransferase CheR